MISMKDTKRMQLYCYNSVMKNNGKPVVETFGKALRFYRVRKRLSQELLGSLIGADQTTISNWEKRTDPPEQIDKYRYQLEEVLGVDYEVLERGEIHREYVDEIVQDETIGRINANLLTIKALDPNGINIADAVISAMVAELRLRRKAREDDKEVQ